MFKVVRMKNISLTKELFQTKDNIADLLSDFEKRRNQTNITVTLSYKQVVLVYKSGHKKLNDL